MEYTEKEKKKVLRELKKEILIIDFDNYLYINFENYLDDHSLYDVDKNGDLKRVRRKGKTYKNFVKFLMTELDNKFEDYFSFSCDLEKEDEQKEFEFNWCKLYNNLPDLIEDFLKSE